MSDTEQVVTTVEQLKELVGQELGLSPWLEVTQERIDAFAEATGDFQWIHVDRERAAASPFGGTIAHGLLTLSLVPMLGHQRHGVKLQLGARMGINYGLNKVRFIAPVRSGKRIRLRTRLLEVAEVQPKVLQLVYEQMVELEGEAKPAMVAESISRQYL